MKEKINYLIAAIVVYFIFGLIISYLSMDEINWKYIVFWTLGMTLADFFILRKLSKRWKGKAKRKTLKS